MPTAIEIFKYLPKKNCGECKHPTCLAFAMALANNKAKVEDCPYISEEGKRTLAASSAPPIRLVKVGSGRHAFEMGDETELYRHEKKFFHPTRYCVILNDDIAGPGAGGAHPGRQPHQVRAGRSDHGRGHGRREACVW